MIFGCFVQFGGGEICLATVPNTAVNFNDESTFQNNSLKGCEIQFYVFSYYFLNILFGLSSLLIMAIFLYQCIAEHVQTYIREKIIKQLESKIIQTDGDSGQCSVCLMQYEIGEECYCLECGHLFHVDCLIDWLKVQSTCPLCRR